MILWSASGSYGSTPENRGGSVSGDDGGGGGIGFGSKVTNGGVSGMTVSIFGAGVLGGGDGVFSGGGVGNEGDGEGEKEKNSGGGIPGGMAGKLMTEGSGGKGGANLGVD
jgi:hypothetical protein